MTYATQENSTYLGRPVELVEFSRSGKDWFYATCDKDINVDANVYLSESIKRNNIISSQDISKSSLSITVPRTNDFVEQYLLNPPAAAISVVIKSFHLSDPAIADPYNMTATEANLITIWTGEVIDVKFKTKNECVILCRPSINSMDRSTLRRVYQVSCPHPLYGDKCKADGGIFKATITVVTTDGISIVAPDLSLQANNYYSGGYVEFPYDGYIIRRSVIYHTGSEIKVNLPLQGIEVGSSIDVYPGCDKLITTCNTKFSNKDNYGGFPFFPDKNPFGGDPIF